MTNDAFVVGVNYPWRHYGLDFGTSAWGYQGLAGSADELRRDFQEIRDRLSGSGKPVTRVFVFADGRASPEFDDTGRVIGLDDSFFRDFDSLVEAAIQSDLQVMPVLLDFRWCYPPSNLNGVCLGGHSDIIRESSRRASFLDLALGPILDRYGRVSEIFAWDLINEPEWVMRWLRTRLQIGPIRVEPAAFRAFVRDTTLLIHERTRQCVTLGSARPQWLRYWQGLGLDLYQCHWYLASWRLRFAAFRAGVRRLDRPCLVGEAPTARARMSPAAYTEKARREGFSGILFWSFRAQDRASDFSKV